MRRSAASEIGAHPEFLPTRQRVRCRDARVGRRSRDRRAARQRAPRRAVLRSWRRARVRLLGEGWDNSVWLRRWSAGRSVSRAARLRSPASSVSSPCSRGSRRCPLPLTVPAFRRLSRASAFRGRSSRIAILAGCRACRRRAHGGRARRARRGARALPSKRCTRRRHGRRSTLSARFPSTSTAVRTCRFASRARENGRVR